MRTCLGELSVKPRHYQIDDDWYLHIYLSSAGPALDLSKHLAQWCLSQGFELGSDKLIVHPSDVALHSSSKWFYLLNERCQLLVRRDELSLEDALIFFLQDAGKSSVNPDELLAALKKNESVNEVAPQDLDVENLEFSPTTDASKIH